MIYALAVVEHDGAPLISTGGDDEDAALRSWLVGRAPPRPFEDRQHESQCFVDRRQRVLATPQLAQEFNFWADPAAAQRVFSALLGKIYLTALNATDFVPITFDFSDRLGADNTTVATATVVTILSDPDVREFMRQGLMYWWDPLNAAAVITGRLVTYERTRLTVVQSGVQAGRTVVDPRGARIRLGVAADAEAFENHFLAMLNGRAPQLPRQRPRHGSPKSHCL